MSNSMILGGHFENMQIRLLRRRFSACQHIKVSNPFLHKMPVLVNFSDFFSWLGRQKSPLFHTKMIAKLEWTQSNAQQNIEQLQTPTMWVKINNESTTIEPSP